jgi:hypothetical protein
MHVPQRLHPPIDFMAQPTKRSPLGFEAQTKKLLQWFWGPNHQTVVASFEAQTGKLEATDFESKPGETVTTGFEAKSGEIVPVVLRPNHRQIVELGFEAQPRNTRSSSPRVWCRPHIASLDLPIVRPPSTQPVPDQPQSNSTLAKSMTHHNQTKELTTWFINLLLDESIDNKKRKV